jgi:hypothetical protein
LIRAATATGIGPHFIEVQTATWLVGGVGNEKAAKGLLKADVHHRSTTHLRLRIERATFNA